MTVIIESMLRKYKENKAYVDTALLRVHEWEGIANCDNIEDYISSTSRDIGDIRSTKISKPVEQIIFQVCKKMEDIKKLISDEKSRIFLIKMEVKHIEIALEALTAQEIYIVECKYFENMFWRNIEYAFNERFRSGNITSEEMLRKKNKYVLKKLYNILEFYIKEWKAS